MASTSDGTAEMLAPRYSSMKQPPLIKQLKGILADYPDGGQIIKELLQNAEDAGATNVQILYDGRRINRDIDDNTPEFTKFFQGPALCVYNDAEFSDQDWDGIRMIYSSVKEEDKLKVGRFGLGFKSVFHITDYPMVISRNQILLIDPQQSADKVNAMVDVNQIPQTTGIDMEALKLALIGSFDFGMETVEKNYYKGTLFWFPLREKPSVLSVNLYDERKVMDLFDGFKEESQNILTFLKNLETITLCTRLDNCGIQHIGQVQILDEDGIVRKSREEFKASLAAHTMKEDLSYSQIMTVRTKFQEEICEQKWLVINYVVGKSASPSFRKLIQDKDLGYSPYVGLAVCLDTNVSFEGHIFCFLPLPTEGLRLTGLPFHVNGFFALSQNRHHLKWATDQQKGKQIDDTAILWNEKMVTEALPRAYEKVFMAIKQLAITNDNSEDYVGLVYRLIPESTQVMDKWNGFVSRSMERLSGQQIAYCKHFNVWVTLQDAVFATFKTLSTDLEYVKPAVQKCLSQIGKNYIHIPDDTFKGLQTYFKGITDMSPQLLSTFLKQKNQYEYMQDEAKFDILAYLLSDGERKKVENLQLLPLASGEWIYFKRHGSTIYVCSESEIAMFPGIEKKFLHTHLLQHQTLARSFKTMIVKGMFQLSWINNTSLKQLLLDVLKMHLGNRPMTPSSQIQTTWLQTVWTFLLQRGADHNFEDIPLFPLLRDGTWTDSYTIDLVALSSKHLILKHHDQYGSLNDDTCICLELLGAKIVPSLPEWIQVGRIQKFVHNPSHDDLKMVLEQIGAESNIQEKINHFNNGASKNNKTGFIDVLSKCANFGRHALQMLSRLHLFNCIQVRNGQEIPSSVADCQNYIDRKTESQFPEDVKFPVVCLRVDTSQRGLLLQLGGRELELNYFIVKTFDRLISSSFTEESSKFMNYFIMHYGLFENCPKIVEMAKLVKFLKVGRQRMQANELFDPSDPVLKSLFLGESVFPETKTALKEKYIAVLRQLGMKTVRNVSANDILRVAVTLDSWSRDGTHSDAIEEKSKTFFKFLSDNPKYLNERCSTMETLGKSIKTLACIQYVTLIPTGVLYPTCLKWYMHPLPLCFPSEVRSVEYCQIAGSTMPLIQCTSEQLANYFDWNSLPPLEKVIDQLQAIKNVKLGAESRIEVLAVLQTIYQSLSERKSESIHYRNRIINEHLIWAGEEFVSPSKIIVRRNKKDIDLRPYFFFMPEEYQKFQVFFETMGCCKLQNIQVLLDALEEIERKYENSEQDSEIVLSDRSIVTSVLNRLADIRHHSPVDFPLGSKVKIMIRHDNENIIKFAPITRCTYDDEDDKGSDVEDGEEDVIYVHHQVNIETAKTLGVNSFTRQCLIEAEDVGLEEWGQSERLTTRIRSLLQEGYTDGLSVPKELIQNADDAGATTVKFLYDERKNTDARKRLFTKKLEECQGPALWVFNDSQFSQTDFDNITKLNGATKSKNVQTIGKFGLGFCSVYNLTDVPSFVSGKHMVVFDPHEIYLRDARRTRGTGLKVDLSKRKVVKRHKDQFKPYDGIFGCDVLDDRHVDYPGTLFRLPLRTVKQANESDICRKVYSQQELNLLLQMLISAAGNLLLFSQNIRKIEVFHLTQESKSPTESVLCFSINKDYVCMGKELVTIADRSILTEFSKQFRDNKDYIKSQVITIEQSTYRASGQFNIDITEEKKTSKVPWHVTWAMCCEGHLHKEGFLPLAAVAVPLCESSISLMVKDVCSGFYNEGHVFCFMPLPIRSGLQIHINGFFSVKSDRTGLVSITEDDKIQSYDKWNEKLMSSSLVKAFIGQLITITGMVNSNSFIKYNLFDIWPKGCVEVVEPFERSFYRALLSENPCVFQSIDGYIPFDKVVCLDQSITTDGHITSIAIDVLSNIPYESGKQIVSLPEDVLLLIRRYNVDRKHLVDNALISEEEMLLHCLNNIENPFWETAKESWNAILKRILITNNERLKRKLEKSKCIPTKPNGNLRHIHDLIHPKSRIANLFELSDERFPISTFCDEDMLHRLVCLGMNNSVMSDQLLVDRCESVAIVSKQCETCTKTRIGYIVEYIQQRDVFASLEDNWKLLDRLKACYMLPVLQRPMQWPFTWMTDGNIESEFIVCKSMCQEHTKSEGTTLLARPQMLFSKNAKFCVGSVAYVLDEHYLFRSLGHIDERVFRLLGVQDINCVPLTLVMKQLDVVADEHSMTSEVDETTETICKTLYARLEVQLSEISDEKWENLAKETYHSILKKPIILIGNTLVRSNTVAVNMKKECPPDLYRLPTVTYSKMKVFRRLGVKDSFTFFDVVEVLRSKKDKWKMKKCDEIETVICLLENASWCMRKESINYDNLENEIKEGIVAPDTDGVLRVRHTLAIEDREISTSLKVKLLHGGIAPDVGKVIGVRSKKNKVVMGISSIIPFGQQEKLTTRLNGLLKDYPCDDSIMKELIQNADDAGATEIHFIKHFDTYSVKRSFGEETVCGPALCIYNNSYFREEDFIGIRNLGIGSKTDDPSKTGQYGIGFNAVYHLTDEPSFLSKGPGLGKKGHLCLFDPLMKHISDHTTVENPGLRCDVDELEETFPGFLQGYPNIPDETGTVFRLPLRIQPSVISTNCMTQAEINNMVDGFVDNMSECLHFVKNIKCIKILSHLNGETKEEYSVTAALSVQDEGNRKDFFKQVANITKLNMQKKSDNLKVEAIDVAYVMTLNASNGMCTKWYILNQFGTKHKIKNEEMGTPLTEAYDHEDFGLLPLCGISVKLYSGNVKEFLRSKSNTKANMTKQDSLPHVFEPTHGKAFCFLPLPVSTGLPFHTNGHFAVDRGRRGLWNQGFRKQWNEYLFANIVVDLFHSVLKYLQYYWVDSNLTVLSAYQVKRHCVDIYHSHFPIHRDAQGTVWKLLVELFYKTVVHQRFCLFPVLLETKKNLDNRQAVVDSLPTVNIKWIHLALGNLSTDGGVFNTVVKHAMTNETRFSKTQAKEVISVLKIIGLSIIETPKAVKKSITEAGVEAIVSCEPELVISFLKTKIIKTEVNVRETLYRAEGVLKSLLAYVTVSEKSMELFQGLPLKMTNDSVVRKFDAKSPTFCTVEYKLLEESPHQFIHKDLVSPMLFCKSLFQKGFLKQFKFPDLLKLLPITYSPEKYCLGRNVRWKESNSDVLNMEKLRNLFSFIYFESLHQTVGALGDRKGHINYDLFQNNLKQLGEWTLLPSVTLIGGKKVCELIPMKNAHHVLSTGGLNETLHRIMKRFNIPSLDVSVFQPPGIERSPIPYALTKITASSDNSDELLKCLFYYKSNVANSRLNCEDAKIVLLYFCQNLDLLKSKLKESLRMMIISLCLFETVEGELTSLEKSSDIVMLPVGMPNEGLCEWGSQLDIVFLKRHAVLEPLHRYLDLSNVNEVDLYADKIVPRITRLNVNSLMTHVEYIKNNVVRNHSESYLSAKQNKIVKALRDLPFIVVNGKRVKVSSLYYKKHPVFKQMISEDRYLPDHLECSEWKPFLKLLGLNKKPSGDMLLGFAKEIARSGLFCGYSESLKLQSKAVCACLFKKEEVWSSTVLEGIKQIKFVVPHAVDKSKRSIHKPFVESNSLVALNESASCVWEDICWTSMKLLKQCPDSKLVLKRLGIYDKPPVEKVIQHCQNVCEVFTNILKTKPDSMSIDEISSSMEKLYKYMDENFVEKAHRKASVTEMIKERLKNTHFILLVQNKTMMKAVDVFTDSSPDLEIQPYLYKAPKMFQRYFSLFELVGAEETIHCYHYISVLNTIKLEFEEKPLPKNILNYAAKAVKLLFEMLLKVEENNVDEKSTLYLPNKECVMTKSTSLTISDSRAYEEMLSIRCDLNLFIGFQELELKFPDPVEPFSKLPHTLMPRILTDDVSENVCINNIREVDSCEANYLENFLRCVDFVNGVVRLLRDQKKRSFTFKYDEQDETNITSNLSKVLVAQVTGLQTFMSYRGQTIDGTNKDKCCFIRKLAAVDTVPEGQHVYQLYFQVTGVRTSHGLGDIVDMLLRDTDGLMHLIALCTNKKLDTISTLSVRDLFRFVQRTHEIQIMLDHRKVCAYNHFPTSRSVFPKEGTYVEQRFYPFMVQGITPFQEHEFSYVAMEMEGDGNNEDESVYIYVHIYKELPREHGSSRLAIRYSVNMGERAHEFVDVPIYRLYRFLPQERDFGQELQISDVEPVGDVPFDETCKKVLEDLQEAWGLDEADRKTIINRLLKRWHPDRNMERQEYANRIFNYIKETIVRLERDQTVNVTIDDNTGRSSPNMSGSRYSHLTSNVYKSGKVIAQAYRDNLSDYKKSTRSGSFVHLKSEEAATPCIPEAKRWLRQAKVDFMTAHAALQNTSESTKGYNWICYMCHQACEKALKAVWFSKDANKCPLDEHHLGKIASELQEDTLTEEAMQLERLLGRGDLYSRLQYPHNISGAHIPSDLFTQEQAEKSRDIARSLLGAASDFIETE